jgi:Uma2 family endonuclease
VGDRLPLERDGLSHHIDIDGEYELQPFRGSDRLLSPTFPSLALTAEQIFDAGSGVT